MPPGQMQFTRMLCSPSSMATVRVSWMTAALAALYTWGPNPARSPATLAVLMMDPPP